MWIILKDIAAETVAALLNNCKIHAGWYNPAGMITKYGEETFC